MDRMLKKVGGLILLGLMTAFVVIKSLYHRRQKNLLYINDAIRQKKEVCFVVLPMGTIAYQWHGETTGDTVVLIHGFSTPSFIFNKNITALTDAGYRVLTYDHYGRGHSDRPEAIYNKDFFDKTLSHLLDHLQIEQAVHLIGYSMGGGIATTFAAHHPNRIKSLSWIAPVGFRPPYSWKERAVLLPFIGKYLFTFVGIASMIHQFEEAIGDGGLSDAMVQAFREQFDYHGTVEALQSTMQYYPMSDLEMDYQILGKQAIPKLLIWGTKDTEVPFSGAKEVRKWDKNKMIRFESLEGAGHLVLYNRFEEVNTILLDFLWSTG